MGEKKLAGIRIVRDTASYLDCLHGLLEATGELRLPKFMLAGMSGFAFRFTIHRRLLPSSLDMYNWRGENWRAVHTLGFYNETYSGSPLDPAFPIYQSEMLAKIKASIDGNRPALAWGVEKSRFYLVTGYSDSDGVLFFNSGMSKDDHILLYDNFGIVNEGDWFLQLVGPQAPKDVLDIYRESLEIAVHEWNCPHKLNPDYRAGKRAYETLIEALECGDYHRQGARYLFGAYIPLKKALALYMGHVAAEMPELEGAAAWYDKLGEVCGELLAYRPDIPSGEEEAIIPHAAGLFREAMHMEGQAIAEIARCLWETMSNKRINPQRLRHL